MSSSSSRRYGNHARSNYAVVLGGYRNHAQGRFSAIVGGSKNTVNGRHGIALGYNAKVSGDYSGAIALFPDESLNQNGIDPSMCLVRDSDTLNICAESFTVNGVDVMAWFRRGRTLSERLSATAEAAKSTGAEIEDLRARGAALDKRAAALLLELGAAVAL